MKLLFDQNISFRLIRRISNFYPEAKQIRELGLENSTDRDIWRFARDNEYTIVTFDADFYELSTYFGHPPRIIWLRTGNRNTDNLAQLLINKSDLIREFTTNESYKDLACIEIE
jgi:predicted nuclease of predicted toxin-antitoxin system